MSDPTHAYVLITRGDGAQTRIVLEEQLRDALHAALCTCPALLTCETEGVKETIASLDNDDEWTHPYPSHERHEWWADFEDGSVSVHRVPVEELLTFCKEAARA